MREQSVILETIRELWPQPAPRGMNSREIVRRAIEFADPPRIPYYFMYNPTAADMVILGPLSLAKPRSKRRVGETYVDAWGVTWEVTGRWWDHAIGFPLADLSRLADYRFPDLLPAVRQVAPFCRLARLAGKYVIGYNPHGMYEVMRSVMGFEALMMAPYTQPAGLRQLLQRLTEMTIEVIAAYGDMGTVDGFHTSEDWGLQTSLQMSIRTFREFYRPCYQRIIDACHERGMHFIWHNCGYIVDMFPDMVEMGVDVLQLDQPRLMGHETLMRDLGGKVCLWNTVDIQWCTSPQVSDDDIRREVAEMVRIYDPRGRHGGFIAKHYPQPWDIGLSPTRQRLIYEAFMENGCRL